MIKEQQAKRMCPGRRWRRRVASFLAVGLLGAAITGAPSVTTASELDDQLEETERQIEQAARALMMTLEVLLGSIPQYEAPVILPNGDILIRRKRPEAEPDLPDGEIAEDATEAET
ncbi:MAG: hypothetical protein ACPGO3_14580 [Magnetospiraceae bacterium]